MRAVAVGGAMTVRGGGVGRREAEGRKARARQGRGAGPCASVRLERAPYRYARGARMRANGCKTCSNPLKARVVERA